MKLRIHIALLFTGICLAYQSSAQQSNPEREIRIAVSEANVKIDSFPILPGTLKIDGVGSATYQVDHLKSTLKFTTLPKADSITITYRRIPVELNKEIKHKDVSMISRKETVNPFSYIPASEKIDYVNADRINTLGAISRGVGFGNQQDVVVNSNLNLKINGRLNNKIDVLAAISDQNNPIQADGNTQQLQDFDRVFIQFRQDNGVLTLGDFDMFTPDGSYFLNYRKRSRGIQFNNSGDWNGGTFQLQAEAAVSRGRFSRNTIEGTEGNQGPYRLTGARGEQFIIIIAGTEVVYLDGKRLVRGEQNDYVINYNNGELTFTPRQLITSYSRIVVEFQYSDRNYGRSVLHAKGGLTKNKWTIQAHYFSEFDNKNQPFQQSLDIFDSVNNQSARQVLANAGDVPAAFMPRITRQEVFNADRIMYEQRDSSGHTIYVHSTDPNKEVDYYEISFSFVGAGNGDYRQTTSTANGKVFEWVEPVNGVSQGDYAPVELLIPPVKLDVMTLQAAYAIDQNSEIQLEFASSNNDLNTFSDLNSADDRGYGMRARYQSSVKLGKDSGSKKQLHSFVDYEFKDRNFTPVERYRSVEFRRTWNRTISNQDGNDLVPQTDEHILYGGLRYEKDPAKQVNYTFSLYDPSSNKIGIRNLVQSDWNKKKLNFTAQVEQMSIGLPQDTSLILSDFLKYRASLSRKLGKTRVGVEYWSETADKQFDESNATEASSYSFREYSLSWQKVDSSTFNYSVQYRNRYDENALSGSLIPVTDAQDLRLTSSYKIDRFNILQLTGAFRELEYLDSAQEGTGENTLQGRLEYNGRLFKRAVRTNFFYELGTGQEQRREFSFIQVGDGNGNFIWNDYDSNGIQSLDEFEVASALDIGRANFIRQFLPVQGFIKSYTTRLSHFVRIQPSMWWRNSKGSVRKTLARFSDVNTVRIEKKVTDNAYEVFLNPFTGTNTDTTLVSRNSVLRNTLYFDQSNPKYGAEVSVLAQEGKLFLFNGFDSRSQVEYTGKVRWNFDRSWTLTVRGDRGTKEFLSDYLETRNYNYDFVRVEPKLLYQYKNNWRLGIFYEQFEAANKQQYGGETSVNKELGLEGKITMVNRGVLQGNFSYVNITYDGDPSTAVSYELLRGLKDGVNWTWNFQVDYRFQNDIQMLFSYEGRKSEATNVIHIGRLQARYLF